MKLFLSSKGLVNEELTERYISFSEKRKKISILTTAAQDYKEENKNNIKLKKRFDDLGFSTTFIDVEFEDPRLLKNAELIVINGGNPYYLLYHLKKTKADQIIKELIEDQIPIKGISSGLLILMNSLKIIDLLTPEMNTIKLEDKRGLGMIEEVIIPHYDRFVSEGRISKASIDRFDLDSGREVIRLGEYQSVIYNGNRKEIVGELLK